MSGTHEFQPEPGFESDCRICGMPKGNRRHDTTVTESKVTDLPEARAQRVSIGFNASGTSVAAGLAHLPASGTLRALILEVIYAVSPDRGVTDEELFRAPSLAGQKVNSMRPRRSDLAAEGWLMKVRDENGREVVRNDHTAWTLTPAGRAKWAAENAA